MAVQSGGGAATIAGANYQSAVAAYFILSLVCDFDTELFGADRPHNISFETANPVDDINIALEKGLVAYLQAKRRLSFSLSSGDDLNGCFDQFVRQWTSVKDVHSLAIVTTSESSRRVTVTLPAIVGALRSGSEADFRRDQNKSLVRDLDLIINALKSIHEVHTSTPLAHDDALDILRRIRVCVLDLANGSPIEQAAYMLLSSRKCISPALFWGNLIADCGSFAAARRSLDINYIKQRYVRYFSKETAIEANEDSATRKLFRSVTSGQIAAGREIVIGTVESEADFPAKSNDICIFEFYRFDENCNERITFQDGKCILQNGLQISLLGRMATYTGLNRFIERNEELFQSAPGVVHFPANLMEDPDESDCAIARRGVLEDSIDLEEHPIECVRCGNPISSNDVDYIEYRANDGRPQVGLTHQSCTLPDDRVIGTIHSEFFKKYHFLKDFDAVSWFKNITRGQGGYSAKRILKGAASPVMMWSGRSARAGGTHIVELELEGGTSEFSFHRGQLARFSKFKADSFCDEMNKWIIEQREKGDPLCISQETIQFGAQSTLLMTVGVNERLRPIIKALVKKYSAGIARRYDVRDSWYAPVAYVRSLPDENPIGIGPSIFLITEPLHLDRFLSNWSECGLELSDYNVPIIVSDEEFDQFAREKFSEGYDFLVDPLFSAGKELSLINGAQLVSLESLRSPETIVR